MIAMAQVLSDDEVNAAAEYFSHLKPTAGYNKVVETDTVAKSIVGAGGMRFAAPDGGTEPIGDRIIVLPMDENEAKLRDPHSGFIDYVPSGSIAKGQALATTGDNGKTVPCTLCHGPDLKGMGEVPRHRRTDGDLYIPPAQRHSGRRPQRRGHRLHEARGRQFDAERHDRACGLSGVAQSVMAGFTNLGDLIRRDRDLSKIAIVDLGGEQGPREFTFTQIDAMANGVARALVKRGLQRGDRVALLSANRAEYIAAYYGIMRAGFVAVPVNFKFPRETIHFIIRDAGAKFVFCDAARAPDCPPELPVVALRPFFTLPWRGTCGKARWGDSSTPSSILDRSTR